MCVFQFPFDILSAQICYRQTRFRASKYIKNAAGALPRTRLGELTALPQAS